MCCNMSDNLATVLDVPRHPKYSVSHIAVVIYNITAVTMQEAMLKKGELEEQYKKQMTILERK